MQYSYSQLSFFSITYKPASCWRRRWSPPLSQTSLNDIAPQSSPTSWQVSASFLSSAMEPDLEPNFVLCSRPTSSPTLTPTLQPTSSPTLSLVRAQLCNFSSWQVSASFLATAMEPDLEPNVVLCSRPTSLPTLTPSSVRAQHRRRP
jgi:hypothetical protein